MSEKVASLDEAIVLSKRLSPSDQLRLIGILSERLRDELVQDIAPIDMLSLAGLGAEIWKDLDTATYLREERASWDG